MRKSRLFLGMAWLSVLLLCLSVIFSKVAIWTARLLSFPSLVGSIVFLALYAKSAREEQLPKDGESELSDRETACTNGRKG